MEHEPEDAYTTKRRARIAMRRPRRALPSHTASRRVIAGSMEVVLEQCIDGHKGTLAGTQGEGGVVVAATFPPRPARLHSFKVCR